MNKDTLSRYRLLERIGAGGMGEVWKAHDGRLDRIVAVKMLLRGALGPLSNDTGRERFRREALTLSRLSHAGIATVFDFDSEGDHDFLVMEFVPGGTLESRLREGPLPLVQIQSLGAAVADALEDAHRHGVLHRDLKPGNVALTTDGRPKILDFGLALLLSGDAVTGRLTQAGTVMGSLAYMAPEQLAGEEEDPRTDVYALGVTLFELADRTAAVCAGPAAGADVRDRQYAGPFIANPPAGSHRRLRPSDCVLPREGPRAPACFGSGGRGSVAAAARHGSSEPSPASARGTIRGIAVLPFRNISQDPTQEYFADGMTEAVISDLARIKALRVISRTSAMHYKGTALSLPEIARELNVEAILEGSAHLVGGRVRLSVQLIAARTDETLWADRYDRQLEDVLGLQSELAETVAREIAVQLTPTEVTQLARRHVVNPEAHLEYLKGRHSSWGGSPEGVDLGLRHAKRALEIDPDFAAAWSALADCHILRATRGMAPPAEAAAEAAAAARRALELNPSLADAHVSIGVVQMHTGDMQGGIRSLRHAIELNPALALAHNMLARALSSFERHEEALVAAQTVGQPGSARGHAAHHPRRRVLLRAPVREGGVVVSHVDRARPPFRQRAYRPRARARSAWPLRRGARGIRDWTAAVGRHCRPVVRACASRGCSRQRCGGAAHSRRAHDGASAACRLGMGNRRRAREPWRHRRGVSLAGDCRAGEGVGTHPAARASSTGSDSIRRALLATRPPRGSRRWRDPGSLDRSPRIAGDAADEAAQQLLRFTSNLTPNFKF